MEVNGRMQTKHQKIEITEKKEELLDDDIEALIEEMRGFLLISFENNVDLCTISPRSGLRFFWI